MLSDLVEEAKIEDTENDIEEAEIKVGVQAFMDTKMKVAVLEVQVKNITKLEEKGKLQERLDGDNFDFLVQQSDGDQTPDQENIREKRVTRFEEDEKWLAQLGDVNLDSLEQHIVADQTHNHEVNIKTLNVVDCEMLEGVNLLVFVDKFVAIKDPYGFRLLVMGSDYT